VARELMVESAQQLFFSVEKQVRTKFFTCSTNFDNMEDHEKNVLMDWYKARDLLIGDNGVDQNIQAALQLVSSCEHEDARWLTALFDGREVRGNDEASDVFLEAPDDARAIFFAEAVLDDPQERDQGQILLSAQLGYGLAQAWLAQKDEHEEDEEHELESEALEWAVKSASQGERNGLFAVGNYLDAGQLGHVEGMRKYGMILGKSNPQRYVWLEKVEEEFKMEARLKKYFESRSSHMTRACVFVIGRLFTTKIAKRRPSMLADLRTQNLRRAMNFYESQCAAARSAVDAWTLVGIRFRVVKDVRILIGKLIWNAREEAEY